MPKPGVKPGSKERLAEENYKIGTYTGLPDTDTEIGHTLGKEPEFVYFTPLSSGVAGFPLLTAKSATSITVKASISGVDFVYELRG